MDKRQGGRDRRRQTLGSIVHGALHPRRRTNRRIADDQVYLVDIYDTGIVMVGLALLAMSCLDAFFTLKLLSLGAYEANWFMRVLIDHDVALFLNVKIVSTSAGVIFLTAMSRFRMGGRLPVRRILETLCAAYACLIIWELYLLAAIATG